MEEKEYEDLIKNDFKNFLYVVWEHLNLPQPSRVQYDIADYLEDRIVTGKQIGRAHV